MQPAIKIWMNLKTSFLKNTRAFYENSTLAFQSAAGILCIRKKKPCLHGKLKIKYVILSQSKIYTFVSVLFYQDYLVLFWIQTCRSGPSVTGRSESQ